MLRQLHVFHNGKQIFNYAYAMALGDEELENVKRTIKSYIDMPIPGKTFQKPLGEFQIFHRSIGTSLFLLITDLVDNREHIDLLLEKIIDRFKEFIPDPFFITETDSKVKEFETYLQEIQHDLHSKIVVIGPLDSGKTTLFKMLKSNDEKNIMNFAKSSTFQIENLKFDIWDFQLKDNYSLLWSKFISGADLILLLFDLSNYHLRVISHFLDLHRNEGKLSKLIIIGNKRDLINEEDIKLTKNELNLYNFEEISLIEPDAKKKIVQLISQTLKLKKSLPSNFYELKEEVERIKVEGNLILAISKYKELINICNKYQDFTFIGSFKQTLKDLQNKVENEKKLRREIERKKKFEIPGQIKFTEKVTVKPLPLDKPKLRFNVTPQAIKPEKDLDKKTEEKIGKLTLFKEKEVLKPEDVKIEIPSSTSEPKTEEKETSSEKLSKLLQELIEKKGSSLNLKFCEHLVSELQNQLKRPLTLKDIEDAATIFVKQDSLL